MAVVIPSDKKRSENPWARLPYFHPARFRGIQNFKARGRHLI